MPDRYAVMGNPIGHSKSPFIHRRFAGQTHQDMDYSAILVPLNAFPEQVRIFQQENGKGLNITLPFKQDAYHLATELSQRAEIAKAVNTLSFLPNDHCFGDNTDGVGLITDLVTNQFFELVGKRILILGAGGATRGILQPLLAHQPSEVIIANRTLANAQTLVREFSHYGAVSATAFDNLHGQFDLIINSISRLYDQQERDLNAHILAETVFCYDLSYGQELTPFLKWAVHHGVRKIADGIGMLVEQAAESFFIWRGVRPNTTQVIAELIGKSP